MRFDNATTQGQADAQALLFRGEERVKNRSGQLRWQPSAGVFDGDLDGPLLRNGGCNRECAFGYPFVPHRLDSIPHQIQGHLLDLDIIGLYLGQSAGKLRHDGDVVLGGLFLDQANSVAEQCLDVERGAAWLPLADQAPDALDCF